MKLKVKDMEGFKDSEEDKYMRVEGVAEGTVFTDADAVDAEDVFTYNIS